MTTYIPFVHYRNQQTGQPMLALGFSYSVCDSCDRHQANDPHNKSSNAGPYGWHEGHCPDCILWMLKVAPR